MICEGSPLLVGMAGAASLVGELRKGLFLAWSCWNEWKYCRTANTVTWVLGHWETIIYDARLLYSVNAWELTLRLCFPTLNPAYWTLKITGTLEQLPRVLNSTRKRQCNHSSLMLLIWLKKNMHMAGRNIKSAGVQHKPQGHQRDKSIYQGSSIPSETSSAVFPTFYYLIWHQKLTHERVMQHNTSHREQQRDECINKGPQLHQKQPAWSAFNLTFTLGIKKLKMHIKRQ